MIFRHQVYVARGRTLVSLCEVLVEARIHFANLVHAPDEPYLMPVAYYSISLELMGRILGMKRGTS